VRQDSARRGCGLHLVVLLEALKSAPETHASTEEDWNYDDMHAVDEPGSKELTARRGASAEAHVLTGRGLSASLSASAGGGGR
jgi:hypothetical protein